jgi:hypothetical protein
MTMKFPKSEKGSWSTPSNKIIHEVKKNTPTPHHPEFVT